MAEEFNPFAPPQSSVIPPKSAHRGQGSPILRFMMTVVLLYVVAPIVVVLAFTAMILFFGLPVPS